jgi:hypothetical protein
MYTIISSCWELITPFVTVAATQKEKKLKPPRTFGKHILLYKVLYQHLHEPLNLSLKLVIINVSAHGNNSKRLVLSKYQG